MCGVCDVYVLYEGKLIQLQSVYVSDVLFLIARENNE